MADDLFSSALPPSLPPTIPTLNNNINKVPVQEKHQKFDKNWLMLHQSSRCISHLPAQDHRSPSVIIPSYFNLLQHTNTVMIAMPFLLQKGQPLARKRLLKPPTDAPALTLKIPSPQAQRLWRQRRLFPKLSHHTSTQTSLTKTSCGVIHLTAMLLQEKTTSTFCQHSVVPSQQNQFNRVSHLAMPFPLRVFISPQYMILNQRQIKRHPLPISTPAHKTPKTSTTSILATSSQANPPFLDVKPQTNKHCTAVSYCQLRKT